MIKKTKHLVESSWEPVIIQTNHSSILNIMQQSSITSTGSTMRMNVRLIRVSQYLCEFCLLAWHKPEKEHVVPDALSKLASANVNLYQDLNNLELYVLLAYIATLVQPSLSLLKKIIYGDKIDELWKKILTQIDNNDRLLENKAILPIERENWSTTKTDPYFSLRPELDPLKLVSRLVLHTSLTTKKNSIDYTLLLFYVNQITRVCCLCIPPTVAKDVLEIAHGQKHSGFVKFYEIVSRLCYIQGLTKLLGSYIHHCPECFILQIRRHLFYNSLKPIEFLSVLFYTLP